MDFSYRPDVASQWIPVNMMVIYGSMIWQYNMMVIWMMVIWMMVTCFEIWRTPFYVLPSLKQWKNLKIYMAVRQPVKQIQTARNCGSKMFIYHRTTTTRTRTTTRICPDGFKTINFSHVQKRDTYSSYESRLWMEKPSHHHGINLSNPKMFHIKYMWIPLYPSKFLINSVSIPIKKTCFQRVQWIKQNIVLICSK
jgi:hypothetical protein